MPVIPPAEVRAVALLARLALEDEEVARLGRELGAILEYVDELRGVDTEGVEPMTHAVPMDCPLREDVAAPSLPADAALAGAPRRSDDLFEVPRVIAEREP